MNYEEHLNRFINMVSNIQDLDEIMIDDKISAYNGVLTGFFNQAPVSDEILERIKKEAKARLNFQIIKPNKILTSGEFAPWFKSRRTEIEMYYWDRYQKYLKGTGNFNQRILDNIDEVTDDITDLLGDPDSGRFFSRVGLVIGDVQSGKTANFIGIINKAADAGYKLIVVLAGTDNELRKQTQLRIDDGFLGYSSDEALLKKTSSIGVAKYCETNIEKRPISVTTTKHDFNSINAQTLKISLDQVKSPIIFVMKKNVNYLNKLLGWITNANISDESGKIDHSILIIDDEADYASLNTNKEGDDPTKTNKLISSLLDKFKRTSYVGFTATPFANVFIAPDNKEEMEHASLFPKDYIYCLESPSNYVSSSRLFGDPYDLENKGDLKDCIKTIETDLGELNPENSIHRILPLIHKKEADFDRLPESLKYAIRTFFIANAIRDLDGYVKSHRSMMVNVSRFVSIQEKVAFQIEEYVKELKNSIKVCANHPDGAVRNNNPEMVDLQETFVKEYEEICTDSNYTWKNIREVLGRSTVNIEIIIKNQKSKDDLKYNQFKEDNLSYRVIAVGGITLSRGLTLEGLIVSYFYRNSSAYDTLMQMGRWFGYRTGYEKLCRVWMLDVTQELFMNINVSISDLKNSISQYKKSSLTPLDFGIRVRNDSSILVTARNKMRTAKSQDVWVDMNGSLIETPFIYGDNNTNRDNLNIVKSRLGKLKQEYYLTKEFNTIGFKNVDNRYVIDLLHSLEFPIENTKYQRSAIIDYINDTEEYQKWDIAIQSGSGEEIQLTDDILVKETVRRVDTKIGANYLRISGKRRRLGGPMDGRFGCTNVEHVKKEKLQISDSSSLSQSDFFIFDKYRNPLLTLYIIQPNVIEGINSTEETKKILDKIDDSLRSSLVAISIGFPNFKGNKPKLIRYQMNIVEQSLSRLGMQDEGDYYDE